MMRLLRRLRGEHGLALPLALIVMSTTGAMVIGIVEFSSSSGRTANVAQGRLSAEALAEAGLANALAVLNYWDDTTQVNNANDPTLLGCDAAGTTCTPIVSTYPSGTATWKGALNSTTSAWTITSIGQVANPTGGPALKKTLTATVSVTWNNTQPANAAAWNYVYSTAPAAAGCEVDLSGTNVVIDIPLYVVGDLCLSGTNSVIDERGEGQTPAAQAIDLRVGGKLVITGNNSSAGLSTDRLTSGAIQGGCSTNINSNPHACTTADDYWVDTNASFVAITAPTADFTATGYYANASPGPKHACVTATNPANLAATTWESAGNTASDNSKTSTFDLTPGTSYQCKTYANDGISGTQIGELSWNASTDVLTVRGVIFIDGNVTTSDSSATYQGTASIYVGGTFSFSGQNAKLCANTNCDFTTWNPNTEMLIMVANGSGNAINLNGSNNKFQGGLFCNPTATANLSGSNVEVQGPVICGRFAWGTNTALKPLPTISQLPLGAPINPNVHAVPATPTYGG